MATFPAKEASLQPPLSLATVMVTKISLEVTQAVRIHTTSAAVDNTTTKTPTVIMVSLVVTKATRALVRRARSAHPRTTRHRTVWYKRVKMQD